MEGTKYSGCSPDGLIGKDGGLECKCPNDKTYLSYLLDETGDISCLPKEYYNQVQMCLMITKRKWWDLAFYNPNFTNNPMIIHRILPDKEVFAKLRKGIKDGEKIIKEVQKKFLHTNKKYAKTIKPKTSSSRAIQSS